MKGDHNYNNNYIRYYFCFICYLHTVFKMHFLTNAANQFPFLDNIVSLYCVVFVVKVL